MGVLTTRQALELARSAGFSADASIVAVAIAIAESGLRTARRGDLGLVGRSTPSGETWGPSLGLWQIRSIQERSGTGDPRDATRLTDPAFNASAAHTISSGGSNWAPWSVYGSGAYRAHLAHVRDVAGRLEAGGTVTDTTADLARFSIPNPLDALDTLRGLPGSVAGSAAEQVGRALAPLLERAGVLALGLVFTTAGLALIALGIVRLSSVGARQALTTTAGSAAAAGIAGAIAN